MAKLGQSIGSMVGGVAGSAFGPVGTVVGAGLGSLVGAIPTLMKTRQERANEERLEELKQLGLSEQELARLRAEQQTRLSRAQQEASNQRNMMMASSLGGGAGNVLPQAIAMDEQRLGLEALGGIEIAKLNQAQIEADRQEREDRLAYDAAKQVERRQAVAGVATSMLDTGMEELDHSVLVNGLRGEGSNSALISELVRDYGLDPETAKKLLGSTKGYDPAMDLAKEGMQ